MEGSAIVRSLCQLNCFRHAQLQWRKRREVGERKSKGRNRLRGGLTGRGRRRKGGNEEREEKGRVGRRGDVEGERGGRWRERGEIERGRREGELYMFVVCKQMCGSAAHLASIKGGNPNNGVLPLCQQAF